ncbi:BrnT family toxin [Castellaniella hirudinis]|uniref:BrnT family toxin n=1 Tax=Castellaniella hirudinis TaxID=1144617 RepID=UPI0039C4A616
MDITYDPAKNSKNIAERGLSFGMVAQFDFSTAIVYADTRKDYGETRYIGIGYIGQRLHVVVFTETETGLRVISLRKANDREIKAYVS